jgi:hypothetical protein
MKGQGTNVQTQRQKTDRQTDRLTARETDKIIAL